MMLSSTKLEYNPLITFVGVSGLNFEAHASECSMMHSSKRIDATTSIASRSRYGVHTPSLEAIQTSMGVQDSMAYGNCLA